MCRPLGGDALSGIGLRAGVWRATAGGASLRALCSGQEQEG
jgi:hypothetical protein